MHGAPGVALHQRHVARSKIAAQDAIGLGAGGSFVADRELEQVVETRILQILGDAPVVLDGVPTPRLSLARTNEGIDRDGAVVGGGEDGSRPQVLAEGALELAREKQMISTLLEPFVAFESVPDERKQAQGFGLSGRRSSQL
jgi:hypothetical protein